MMREFSYISIVALLSAAAFGQAAETRPAFEAADVHASARTSNLNPFMSGGALRGGRYDLRRANMLDLIRIAYSVDPDTVLGGPNWLELNRFDITAKAPTATSRETVRLMLQTLLADRFKLVTHKDTKPLPAYALIVGKGKPKLKEADESATKGCQFQPQNPAPGTVAYMAFACRSVTMASLAQLLRAVAGRDYLTIPVVDSTELNGSWDFDLKWNIRQELPQARADAITVFDAVDKQLGLKLELQKHPAPVLVVDSVNERPTDNPPEVAKILPPPPPAEFEVADVKLSMPDARPFVRLQPGGRFEIQGYTVKMMIQLAWNLFPEAEEMVDGLPKSADSTRFDILAKAPNVSGPGNAAQVDFDDIRLMLRALLADRFKLGSHMEDRPISAYALMAAKPKLTQADPSNRTGCKEAPAVAKDPRDTNPARSRLIICHNMTMAQFGDLLPALAPRYVHNPVLDSTGLDGAWDFTLSFSTVGAPGAAVVETLAKPPAARPRRWTPMVPSHFPMP
jgi:uncharacterized protein (TIGR03435 family)